MTRLAARLNALVGAAFGSSAAPTHRLTDADQVLRRPLPLCRRLSFVALHGGTGCSATAAYVASLCASRRHSMILSVEASARPRGLAWHAGLPAEAVSEPSPRRRTAQRAREARDGLPISPSGAYTVTLGADDPPQRVPDVARWAEEVSPIARFYDVVCTDWGVRPPAVDLADVADLSHVVCLVARADRASYERTAAAVPHVLAALEQPRVVLAVVDVAGCGLRPARVIGQGLEVPVVTIPYDRGRAGAAPVSSTQLARRTRLAYIALATELILQAQAHRPARPTGAAPTRPSAPRAVIRAEAAG